MYALLCSLSAGGTTQWPPQGTEEVRGDSAPTGASRVSQAKMIAFCWLCVAFLQLCGLWCSYSLSNAIRCDFLSNSNFMNILQSYSFVSLLFLAFFK